MMGCGTTRNTLCRQYRPRSYVGRSHVDVYPTYIEIENPQNPQIINLLSVLDNHVKWSNIE